MSKLTIGTRASCLPPRPTTHRAARLVPRASGSSNEIPPATAHSTEQATVFYAGRTFTESEWKTAVNTGVLDASTPSSAEAAVATVPPPSFGEIMAFDGAPERINSRLAMLGIVAAIAAELASGQSVLSQWAREPTLITVTFVLIIAGSFAPLINNTGTERRVGPFTPDAEIINGRAACLGFAALLAIEAVKGSALF